ncbi:Na+/H+ antiporter subunit E [Rubellimicrobium roseum]|uniref:Na+/H+ antiporter subunit E n=1 Tax=Rubellimicrobium roseum TaxID=687525 RepID=A0A5C4N6U2_9RHOB|nr:Na+/H+ antiporter subunit E [Rubellimicrobium roseum]TNC61048.1 Na+/H+ antiporter subunit E [Rubellimicrobium roseum]
MFRRLLPHPVLSTTLLLVWLLLVNDLSAGAAVLGLAIGIAVPLLTAPYWPDRPRLRVSGAMLRYLAVLLWDIVVANFEVAWVILTRPSARLRSAWLVVPLEVRSPEAITVLAGTISLTPGTVSVDLSGCGHALLVHALDVSDEAETVARIKGRYEAPLKEIFE